MLHGRHRIAGVAAGHVHGPHDVTFGDIAVHATPSTFMGAGGPGYRIFDFGPDGFTTTVRPTGDALREETLSFDDGRLVGVTLAGLSPPR